MGRRTQGVAFYAREDMECTELCFGVGDQTKTYWSGVAGR